MKTSFFMIPAVVLASGLFACGSGGGTGGTTSTGTGTATGSGTTTSTGKTASASTSTGGGKCPVADKNDNCLDACNALYDCGALTCNGTKLCAGFTGAAMEKDGFVNDPMNGCVHTCMGQMALLALIDPTDCKGTINAIEGVSSAFKNVCTNGFMSTTSSSSGSTSSGSTSSTGTGTGSTSSTGTGG